MSGSEQIRCPEGPKRLLAIVRMRGEKPTYTDDGMLIEFACYDCAKSMRKQGYDVARVLHQYNVLGEFVSSVTITRGMEA